MTTAPGNTQSTHTLRLLSDANSMKKGLDAVDKELSKVVIQMDKHQAAAALFNKESEATKRQLDRLTKQYVPLVAAQKKYETSLIALDRSLKANTITQQQYEQALEQVNAEYDAAKADELSHSMGDQAEAVELTTAELDQLRAQFDPLYAASLRYEQQLEELTRAHQVGALTSDQYDSALERLNAQYKANQLAATNVGKVTKQNTFLIQQAGYQFGDFFTQIAGGTSPMRAFAQQFGQIAQFLGPIGLAASVAVPALIALGPALFDAGDGAEDAKEALEEFNRALADYKQLASDSIKTTEQLAETYGRYAEDVRQALILQRQNALELAIQKQTLAFDEAAPALGRYADKLEQLRVLRSLTATNAFQENQWLQDQADILNELNPLTEEQVRQLLAINQAYSEGGDVQNQLDEAREFRKLLLDAYGSAEEIPKQLNAASLAMLDAAIKGAELAAVMERVAGAATTVAGVNYGTPLEWADDLLPPESESTVTVTTGGGREQQDELERLMQRLLLERDILTAIGLRKIALQELGREGEKYEDRQIQDLINLQREVDELTQRYQEQIDIVDALSGAAGQAFTDMITGSKSVEDALKDMARTVVNELFRILVLQRLIGSWNPTTGAGSGLAGWLGGLIFSAKGNVFNEGNVVPFAQGGVVSSPAVFPMTGGQVGIMGEAGPEAIMPLSRNSAGELGVAGPAIQINNYTGQEVTVDREEQLITIAVGRAQQAVEADFTRGMNSGQGPYARGLEGGYRARRKAT